ncbi:cytochrome c3 family protein [Methanococcoides methylutens]|uniref:cytochrome c3 family protein n=1 Tax=Methanococcoides methylutens TaxID=2226 RepID=UPI004043EFC2
MNQRFKLTRKLRNISGKTLYKHCTIPIVLLMVSVLFILTANVSFAIEEPASEFDSCEPCHSDIITNFSSSLHYTGSSMKGEYEKGAAGEFGIDMHVFYEERGCSACHATSCTSCHTGEGGHGGDITLETCDQCHFKKQTSYFQGELPAHKGIAPNADVHYEKGLDCIDCHTAEEVHGDGVAYGSQMEAVKTTCADCHTDPEKIVNGMAVTQYSIDNSAHSIHDEKLDCSACHSGWVITCENCHLETGQLDKIDVDRFYLARSVDGTIKPFINMTASYNNSTHTAFAEWVPHTTTSQAKDCVFCHENTEIFISDRDGVILGAGGSFLSQETIDRIAEAPLEGEAESEDTPFFVPYMAIIVILAVYLLMKRK